MLIQTLHVCFQVRSPICCLPVVSAGSAAGMSSRGAVICKLSYGSKNNVV
jgi:hypothetical protein